MINQKGKDGHRICEENGPTFGMDTNIIQGVKLSSVEIVQEGSGVEWRSRVNECNRSWTVTSPISDEQQVIAKWRAAVYNLNWWIYWDLHSRRG